MGKTLLLYINITNRLEVVVRHPFNFLMVKPKTLFYTTEAYRFISIRHTVPTGILVNLKERFFAVSRRSIGRPISELADEKTVRNIKSKFNVEAKASTVPSETPVFNEVLVRCLTSTRN